MKTSTKKRIVLFCLYALAAFGIASIVYGIELYFFEKDEPLTPYGIWAGGFGSLIAAGTGFAIQSQRKRGFHKLEIDENTLKSFDNLSKTFRDVISSQIDTSTQFLDTYVKMRISTIESFDRYAQVMMRIYANMLSHFNSTLENKW